LREGDHRFFVVIEESVLRNVIGGAEVMSGQLGHLITVASSIARATPLHAGDWTRPVTDNARSDPPADLILTEAEVARRVVLLTELRHALAMHGACGVLTRNHSIVLRYPADHSRPSGMTEPKLHVFMPGGRDIITTDGSAFHLTSGAVLGDGDLAAAARAICRARCAR